MRKMINKLKDYRVSVIEGNSNYDKYREAFRFPFLDYCRQNTGLHSGNVRRNSGDGARVGGGRREVSRQGRERSLAEEDEVLF